MQQRECIAKKEGRLFKENAQNASNELPLEIGQNVYHQDPHTKKWHPGVIENTCKEPHSFLVRSSNGAVYRRNRNFLKSRQTEGFVQKPQNPAVKPFQPPEQQSPSNTMVNPVPQASQVQQSRTHPLRMQLRPTVLSLRLQPGLPQQLGESPAGPQKDVHPKDSLMGSEGMHKTCIETVHSV